jgi:nicotinate phosphoribosyltransferase
METEFVQLSSLSLTNEEKAWCIKNIPYIPENYWEWLSTFRFNPELIKFSLDDDGVFQCEVTDKMYRVTLYEIAVLATFAEVRNTILGVSLDMHEVSRRLLGKIELANQKKFSFSEFGTRRRFSSLLQEEILKGIKIHSKTCAGTSNVFYARQFDMTPTGTFPHEWMMFHAGVFGYKRANYLGLEDWVKVYDGNLGTALTDTYTTASFLRTLTRKQAHLFSGFRVDSGDEYEIGDMIIDRLDEFGIDASSKLLIFSNALDFEKAAKIFKYFKGRAKVSFGIGTNLTCDTGIEGYTPANIVMKLSRCRMSDKDPWEYCIKISDDYGKHMGDEQEFGIAEIELHLNLGEVRKFIPV